MTEPTHADVDDADLVERARAGDHRAYAGLVRRHQGTALRVAYAICGSASEAEDVAQEAFVKAYRALGAYRAESPWRPWLLRIVANEAKNRLRADARRRRTALRHTALAAQPPAEPDEVALGRITDELVLRALASLPDVHRQVLACRFVAGLSESETAAVLDVAPGTVKSRQSRALERLRDALVEEVTDE
jgi:RNA polymerase sigma-70 factor (ECF subfamily)